MKEQLLRKAEGERKGERLKERGREKRQRREGEMKTLISLYVRMTQKTRS